MMMALMNVSISMTLGMTLLIAYMVRTLMIAFVSGTLMETSVVMSIMMHLFLSHPFIKVLASAQISRPEGQP